MKCFRCSKTEPETHVHLLVVRCNAWKRVLFVCSNCVQWFQNILHDAAQKGIEGP
jgi:hypothetical protein